MPNAKWRMKCGVFLFRFVIWHSAFGILTDLAYSYPKEITNMTNTATFAAGCFWGVEATFAKIPGVTATQVGYIGGTTKNPSYEDVCNDDTGHAEAVQVTFDPSKVSYAELLDAFWSLHDPTTLNRQGPDIGSQYRSAIFYHDAEQEGIARASLKEVQDSGVFRRPIATQIVPAEKFYSAEEYHQKYFQKLGRAESCHIGVAKVHTRLAEEAAEARRAPVACDDTCGVDHWQVSDEELRKRLTPEQYNIARKAGTERAFTGKYWDEHRPGIYRCAVCGQELFNASAKFDSGTGWPSFYQPITPNAVEEHADDTYGMRRVEALCSRCKSHLGHVFDDGPRPTGERFCMNSAVLDFQPAKTSGTSGPGGTSGTPADKIKA
jgi:peptide methionine sulfoxide reductase msrA/msrB